MLNHPLANPGIPEVNWKSFYKAGAVSALLAVLVALADIILTFLPAGAEQPGTLTAVDWFHLFQTNWFFGLRNLGLLPNILTLILLLPVFLALYAAHRREHQPYAALAVLLSIVGTGIYLSNNAAFPMLALSTKYAAATTEVQRQLLVAAGEAILAHGEDFTPGAFTGFLFTEIAMIAISLVMLRSEVFGKGTAYTGLLGGVCMTVFTIWSTFIPLWFEAAMLLAMFAGLLYIAWYILIARRLFQLGNESK